MRESADDPLPHHFERTTGELLTVSLIGGNTSSDGNWVCYLDNGCMIATCLGTFELSADITVNFSESKNFLHGCCPSGEYNWV